MKLQDCRIAGLQEGLQEGLQKEKGNQLRSFPSAILQFCNPAIS
jgi:hypothetical protein